MQKRKCRPFKRDGKDSYRLTWDRVLPYRYKVYIVCSLGLPLGEARFYAKKPWSELPLSIEIPILRGEAFIPIDREFVAHMLEV